MNAEEYHFDEEDDFEYGYDSTRGIYIVPVYTLTIGSLALELTWTNTVIRTFIETECNHLEYYDEHRPREDIILAIKADEDTIAQLQMLHFPEHFRPIVDEATAEWLGNMLVNEIMENGGIE